MIPRVRKWFPKREWEQKQPRREESSGVSGVEERDRRCQESLTASESVLKNRQVLIDLVLFRFSKRKKTG